VGPLVALLLLVVGISRCQRGGPSRQTA